MTTTVPETKPPSNGHGGYRPGSGRPRKTEQNDANTLLAKAKAKRETYKAQLAELEYKKAVGELIPRDEVVATWIDHIQIAKGRLMALPSRVSADVAQTSDLKRIEQTIRAALFDIIQELAGDDGS